MYFKYQCFDVEIEWFKSRSHNLERDSDGGVKESEIVGSFMEMKER